MSRRFVRRSGFSVVEVLVIVGIIAMLFAILLPSMKRARTQAARVGCQSNLRQIALASAGYAIDNHDYLPYPNWQGMDAYYPGAGWLYLPGTPFTATAEQTGVLWPYLKNARVYKCQSDPGPYVVGNTHIMTSYVMNGAVCGFGMKNHLPSFKVHSFRPDAIVFWEADTSNGCSGWNDGSNFPPEGLSSRHGDASVVAMVDGHVDWLAVPAYNRLQNQSPGPLWCDPAAANGH